MQEITVNLHIHTRFSDGSGLHKQVIDDALNAEVDCIIFTDHNVRVEGIEGIYRKGTRKLWVISGEEIHNQARQPQKNHLLVFGHNRELATYGYDPQNLINHVNAAQGLSFLAHPTDPALEIFHEGDISWEDWSVNGYTGLELWNGFAEMKFRVKNYLHGVFYAFNPDTYPVGPHPKTVEIWDSLTKDGKQVVAICGSDAHALPMSLGPIRRTIFPYNFHFRALNNHLLIPDSLSGDYAADRKSIINAFKQGHLFIGNSIPANPKGFRFYAQTGNGDLEMGDKGILGNSATIQIKLPHSAECRLLRNGQVFKQWSEGTIFSTIVNEPGTYRVEVFLNYLGKRRSWIISNPIYLMKELPKAEQNPWSQTTLPDF
ncbi:MAG TPA: hypothetical protein PKD55_03055 [Bellilinea sp.]|nr:hypothetical protein [Bellilinea sp.]